MRNVISDYRCGMFDRFVHGVEINLHWDIFKRAMGICKTREHRQTDRRGSAVRNFEKSSIHVPRPTVITRLIDICQFEPIPLVVPI